MLVKVRLFARLREIAGAGELERAASPGTTTGGVWQALVGEFADLAQYSGSISCAVNDQYAKLTTELADGDEVAFLPPVSGGRAPATGP